VEFAAAGWNARLAAGVLFFALGLSGCALIVPQSEAIRGEWPAGVPLKAEIEAVPFFPQQDNSCGPAALATTMGAFGVDATPEALIGQVYLPAREGSLQVEMLAAPRRYGMVSYKLAPTYEAVLREVAAGNPVIVLQDYGVWPVSLWHYAVVVGYDRSTGEAILRSGEKRRLSIPFGVLEYTWKESDYWAMVAVPPSRLPATATEADYLASVLALERLGNTAAAGTAYATLLQRWPGNLVAAIGRANSLYSAGNLAGAEAVLRQAVDKHPESAVALNNLAQTLSDLGRNAEALERIEQARTLAAAQDPAVRQSVQETHAGIVRRLGGGG
jgi:hypothetical protein